MTVVPALGRNGAARAAVGACACCGSDGVAHWPSVDVVRCTGCGLLFRSPAPTPAELDRLYRESWDDPSAHEDETGGTTPRLARVYARALARSLGRTSFEGQRVLDFGAGNGAMSQALTELGARVVSVDPYAHERLANLGLDAAPSLDAVDGAFDGCVSVDAIEHVADPQALLAQLHDALVPGGWLYLSTLNARSLNARLTRERWREVVKSGHLWFFDATSLRPMLARAGFAPVRRPRWLVAYSHNPLRRLAHAALQLTRLETGLRILAFREDGR